MQRRDAIKMGLLGVATFSTRAFGQAASTDRVLPGDGAVANDPKETIELWPGTPPGGAGLSLVNRVTDRSADPQRPDRFVDHIGKPSLTAFRPARPDGSAVVIAPGGGYVREVLDGEGYETARRLNAAGVTAFVLRYRLPGEGWQNRSDVPLQDAQRAVRLVRARATQFAIDPARVGIAGFSAGGHVAASLATRSSAHVYTAVDQADTSDPHPAFAVLIYPVVTMGDGAHGGSRTNLLGASPSAAQIATYSCERNVTAQTPPTFIALAADDRTVPPLQNGIAMYNALRAANVAAELHVFEEGGHGFGIARIAGKPGSAWPDLLGAWMRRHNFVKG
jgi:acetyl esterase/lipase